MNKSNLRYPAHHRLAILVVTTSAMTMGCGLAGGEIVSGTFSSIDSDITARFFHKAGLLNNGTVLVSGGMRVQLIPATLVSLDTISFLDPNTNTFSANFQPTGGGPPVTPVLATPRSSHTQTTLQDGRVLFTGGNVGASGTNPGSPTNAVEIFDPVTGLVQSAPPMAITRAFHSATRLADGRVLVAGGGTWQVFDPTTDMWSADMPLQQSRIRHAAVLLDQNRVLLIAGIGAINTSLEIADADAGTSTLSAANLSIAVNDLAAGRLIDGRVIVVGGQSNANGDTIGDSYLYDPATDALASIPSPPNRAGGISDHELVVIGSHALIFGGEEEQGGADTELDYAAVFDSVLGAWTFSMSMNNVHDDFASVLLPDNRIALIDGGIPFLGQEVSSSNVEVFEPAMLLLGDVNNDGKISLLDVPLFAITLVKPDSASTLERCAADANGDQMLDGDDIIAFLALIVGN